MREILFKARRIDNGEWIEGSLIDSGNHGQVFIFPPLEGASIMPCRKHVYYEMVGVDSYTICQYTGLCDKNGKKIWENDIVEAWSEGVCAKGKIKHRIDGHWIMYPAWQNGEMWYLLPNENGITTVEVIGNVFDNPELLEVN